MTQYNTLNTKLSNSQLNKFKSGIKNNTQVTLNLSSNMVVILSIGLIFHKNYCCLIHGFVKLLQMVNQLI